MAADGPGTVGWRDDPDGRGRAIDEGAGSVAGPTRAACRPLRTGPPACGVAGDGSRDWLLLDRDGPTLRPQAAGSTTLGCLELDNQFGQASDPFTASYWFNTGWRRVSVHDRRSFRGMAGPRSRAPSPTSRTATASAHSRRPRHREASVRIRLKAIALLPGSDLGHDLRRLLLGRGHVHDRLAPTLKPTTGQGLARTSAPPTRWATGGCAPVFPSARFDWDGTRSVRRSRRFRCHLQSHAQADRCAETERPARTVTTRSAPRRCDAKACLRVGHGRFEVLRLRSTRDADPHAIAPPRPRRLSRPRRPPRPGQRRPRRPRRSSG